MMKCFEIIGQVKLLVAVFFDSRQFIPRQFIPRLGAALLIFILGNCQEPQNRACIFSAMLCCVCVFVFVYTVSLSFELHVPKDSSSTQGAF